MRKCAEQGCSNLVYSDPSDRDLCYEHKRTGCFGMLLMILFYGILIPNLVIGLIMHATPRFDKSGEVCWIKDLAWPWEDQVADVKACISYSERK